MILLALIISINAQCNHPIYCQGTLLHAVQTNKIFVDGKTFVDMPMKAPQATILEEWKKVDRQSKPDIEAFIQKYFDEAGSDLEAVIPSDYSDTVEYSEKIKIQELKTWSLEVNKIFKELCKKFKKSDSSMLNVPNEFFVPGGRFREFYYWDTMWVIDGLLISKMFDSAIKMHQNFVFMVNTIGYIPNGARVYYLGRTQPPVLIQITNNIYQALIKNGQIGKAKELLNNSFQALEKEFQYFYEKRGIRACSVFPQEYCDVMLFHYDSDIRYPRPESYNEDLITARFQESVFHDITAGAESGWDFSTRWFSDSKSLESIQTSNIIAVDLNVFMILNMKILSQFSSTLGLNSKKIFYDTLAQNTETLILEKLYNKNTFQWNDYDYKNKKFNSNFYASNYFPLLLNDKADQQIIDGLEKLINQYPGGLPTSIIESGQQWDLPNSWPPLNQMIIKGLILNNKQQLALKLSQQVIDNAYCSYENSKTVYGKGYMFEKYNAKSIGTAGGGGEYEVQTGFGWTNGVVIWILDQYADKLSKPVCN